MAGFNKHEFDKLRAKRHATKVKQRQEIREIKHKNDPQKRKPAYSKMLVAFIFLNCLAIQAFICYMIYLTRDTSHLSSLVSLIGTLAVQALSLISYNKKAQAENTVGGLVYNATMLNLENIKQPTIHKDEDEVPDMIDAHDEAESVG